VAAAPDIRSRRQWAGIYGRGIAMGIAEVVPGVSGGTIAFVTGIYDELIHTLASFRPASLRLLTNPTGFWQAHNLSFLLALGLGMLTGVALFAHLLSLALEHARPVVWAFFLGVISLSVYLLGRDRSRRGLLLYLPIGLVLGVIMGTLDTSTIDARPWMFFLGGAVAVAAWLLPAVSGSFILLALGLYEGVLAALVEVDLPIIAMLLGGCLTGLLCFANFLSWLMRHHREGLLSLLTGFMAGSLLRLWPWANAEGALFTPAGYQQQLAADPLLVWVIVSFLAGTGVIWWLSRLK